MSRLLRAYIDGIPLAVASRLLPTRTWLRLGLVLHVHLHARAQSKAAGTPTSGSSNRKFSRTAYRGIIDSLRSVIEGLRWAAAGTEWIDYYESNNNYDSVSSEAKGEIVRSMLQTVGRGTVWDLGANTGKFSRIARACGFEVCAWDVDPACVDNHYRSPRASSTSGILPLLLDLTNPTPAFGWDHSERMSLRDRGPADVLLALGLIHHLAIGNNVPLPRIAEMLANLGRWLIIEFVPKVDSQVRKLLASRADVFPDYDIKGFADAFSQRFRAVAQRHVNGSERTLFLMERLND